MVSVSTSRAEPRITFSALCEYLAATPVRQASILRDQKFPQVNQLRSYQGALAQIQAYAIHKRPLDPQHPDLTTWEREVLELLADRNWRPPSSCAFPNPRRQGLTIRGVKVSVHPDLLLRDSGLRAINGSMKFFFSKSFALSPEVGRWMAAFLCQYRIQVDKDASTDPKKCVVLDVRKDVCYSATRSYKTLFRNVEEACETIAARWPRILPK